jgi:glucose-1-phosphate cytidylyltransferase
LEFKKMKVIILAGGYGTRLSEYTDRIPKPMVTIGGYPILWHIMKNYAYFGHSNFFLALGYKAGVIKDYFLHYRSLNADFTINLSNDNVTPLQTVEIDWKVSLVDTGLETMTGGRVKRMQSFIGDETFLLTYGDGLANIDIEALIAFHRNHGKMVTISAVRPGARFGEITIKDDNTVASFKEKPQTSQGWINGGFFVIEPSFFDLIEGDRTILEKEPLEMAAKMGELKAFSHSGFWQCMDTKRDHDSLENLFELTDPPWIFQKD